MFTKKLYLLSAVAIFVFFAGYSGTGNDYCLEMSAYAAATKQLKVTAPVGWVPNASNASMMMKGSGTYSIKVEYMPAEARTPDAFIDYVKKALGKTFKNCTFGPVVKLKVSGYEARRMEYAANVYGMKMKYIVLYVFDGSRVPSLTCGAMEGEFAKLKSDYEKIIASVRME